MNGWNDHTLYEKLFLWIDILGVPLQFWCPNFFQQVTLELREFMASAEAMLSKSRLDVATILISASLGSLHDSLHLIVIGAPCLLRI